MAKKIKLNSKNPKYFTQNVDNESESVIKKLMCNAPIRNVSGEIVSDKTVPVYYTEEQIDSMTIKEIMEIVNKEE